MKGISRIIALLLVSVFFYQCQKEISFSNNGNNSNGKSSPVEATLQGVITDENNDPVEGAVVKVGTKNAVTDADGYFRILRASLNNRDAMVTVEKAGYFKGIRTFAATSGANMVSIQLIRKNIVGSFSATSGGNVALSNGTKVSLPANAVVTASGGTPYSGTVNVLASYIDPSSPDISQTVPGSFMADDKNNKRVVLSSYGMVAVELVSGTGEKLQVKSGSAATLTMSIPSAYLNSAPQTIALWYVDEQTGIWKEEGTATRQGSFYVGEVKHFSFWNCDVASETYKISMQLRTPSDLAIVHATVRLRVASQPNNQAYGITDSIGKVSGMVPANVNLVMEVLDPCDNVVYSQNIPGLTQNTDLGFITVNSSLSTGIMTIEGNLKKCNGSPVTDGYAIIYFGDIVRFAGVNASGHFSTTVVYCASQNNDMKILAVDNADQQQDIVIVPNISSPTTNAGNIAACGNSSAQYLNYTLDGTNYSINFNPSDSMTAFTSSQGAAQYQTSISGFNPPSNMFGFWLSHPTMTTGTYPLSSLTVQNYSSVTLVQPFNVTFTTFPQVAGQFYEGTLSGQFRDAQNVLHNVSSNFRVRRSW